MSDSTLTLLILAAVVVLFVSGWIPVEIVAVGSALVLYATGILTLPQSLAGFADPAVLLIASLFIVSEGLDASGVTTWVGQSLVTKASTAKKLLLLTMLLVAGLTALIGLNGAVAALLPMVVVMAMRRSILPSRLLMPLAFAGSAGGLLLLTGSPVNVVISEAAADAGVGAFGFAEFALVGVPVVVGTITIVLLFGDRLVPQRRSDAVPPDLSGLARTLVESYSLNNVVHLRVLKDSDFIGRLRVGWDIAEADGVRIITVMDGEAGIPTSEGHLAVGDRITALAYPNVAEAFAENHGLSIEAMRTASDVEQAIMSRESGAAEVVLPPRSELVGQKIGPSQVIDGSLIVLAMTRNGRDLGGYPVRLEPGDTLLVEGPWAALETAESAHDLLVVDSPDLVRRQSVPLGSGSGVAIAVLLVMVVLLITGVVPAAVAAMLAAGAMVLGRVLTMQQAYRGISWTTVLLVAGMIPMATAVTESGAGQNVATVIVGLVGDSGPLVLLLALFVMTVTFSQLISNTATALVMIPIALSAAQQLDISPRPVLMSLCVGAAVAFLTPVATPANLMVMGPAGYRFGDYWRLGLPLVVLFGVVSILVVPLIWSF